jgi:4-amino-4-deoxy-L-arabinose transferase-like glycosyltransferase
MLASAWLWHLARALFAAATTDEAFTAIDFASRPWLDMLAYYDANNHVLHTVAVKLSLAAFGWNLFALRLPALLAALLYSFALWRLGRRWFGDTLAFFAFCAAAAWAAPVAEYFSLARGYAMALAFFTWALLEADDAGTARWPRVSLAMGLGVASNLVFVIPSAALTAALLLRERNWRDFRRLAAPGAVLSLIVVSLPLSRAEASSFYYGASNWLESLRSITEWPGLTLTSSAAAIALPLLSLTALFRPRSRTLALTNLLSISLVAALAAAGVPWPRGRTGAFLSLLMLLAAMRWVLETKPALWFVLLIAPASWLALPLRFHPEWFADASSRIVVQRIAAHAPASGAITVSVVFPLNYAIAFHAREILGPRASVFRSGAHAEPAQFIVTQGDMKPAGRVLFHEPATSLTLSVPPR